IRHATYRHPLEFHGRAYLESIYRFSEVADERRPLVEQRVGGERRNADYRQDDGSDHEQPDGGGIGANTHVDPNQLGVGIARARGWLLRVRNRWTSSLGGSSRSWAGTPSADIVFSPMS